MYKMIVCDIDDTLLNDDLMITEGTKKALTTAAERGFMVTIATGRMFASAKKVAAQLGLNVPIISYQGALIKNLQDGEVLYERYVPTDLAKLVHAYCEENGLFLNVYYNDEMYIKAENDKSRYYQSISGIKQKIEPDLSKMLDKPMPKMLIIDEPDLLDQLIPVFEELTGGALHITKSKPNFLEFMHKEGSKGQAITHLAKHYGISLSEVIACGDSWNDHDMIEVAGLGVAMGNAIEPLKQIADYVTMSNNEDGIQHVVEKFMLG